MPQHQHDNGVIGHSLAGSLQQKSSQRPVLVHELFENIAAKRPDATAVNVVQPGRGHRLQDGDRRRHLESADETYNGDEYTFCEINQMANNAANALRSIWCRNSSNQESVEYKPAEHAVVILVDEGVGLVVSELAVLKCGAAFVPVDPNWPAERIAFIVQDCAARAVIVSQAGAADCIAKMRSAAVAICQETFEEQGSSIPAIVIENAMATNAVIPDATSRPNESASRDQRACHIIYTSGSTGQPKGVVCEHASLVNYIEAKAVAHGINASSRVLVAAASTWDPSVGDLFCALSHGAVACVASRASLVEELPAVLQASRASHICTTPALWAMLPRDAAPSDFPNLAVLALGGERMSDAVVSRWGGGHGGLKLLNTYGVTEATVYQTVHELRAHASDEPEILAGRALSGVKLEVDGDPDRSGVCAGEILIGGVQVARGYLNRPELTASKFFVAEDGTRWFRSGDLGRWVVPKLEEGSNGSGRRVVLKLLGRIDLQVKLRGFRIELEEVEAVVKQCPLVRNAAVVLHQDDRRADESESSAASSPSARLVAFVETTDGDGRSFEAGGELALRIHCQRRMPAFQVPAQLVRVCEPLPLTASGKLNRKALPAPPPIASRASATLAAAERKVEPRTLALEKAVGELWQDVLGVDKVGPWDHFWDLGGNSILAVRMLNQLEATIGEQLVPVTTGRWASTGQDRARVRLCGLHRKPRLKDFVRFLEWAAVTAPNVLHATAESEDNQLAVFGVEGSAMPAGVPTQLAGKTAPGAGDGRLDDAAEVLRQLDADRPVADDEQELQQAAITLAAQGGHLEVVRCLLGQGASTEGWAGPDHSASPLMLAAGGGHAAVVAELLAAGASVRPVDALHNNALHMAAAGGYVDVIELLLSPAVGAPRDARTLNKWSAVHHAAFHGHVPAIQALERHGASLNLKDRWSRTPLAWAVFGGHAAAAEHLIANGGHLLEGGEHGRNQPQLARQRRLGNRWSPAIMLAVQAVFRAARAAHGDPRGPDGCPVPQLGVFELLLRHAQTLAIKVNAVDAEGRTALHQACLEVAGGGDDAGTGGTTGDALSQDEDRGSAVGKATDGVNQCTEAVLERLFKHGAEIGARDLHGQTPLHIAAAAGSTRAIALLLQRGAEVAARDRMGKSALEVVGGVCAQEVKDLLLAAMEHLPAARIVGREQTAKHTEDAARANEEELSRPGIGGWVATQNALMGAEFFVHVNRAA